MVLEWEQQSGLLYTTGDVRYIRVWDTHKELKIQDIITEADSCVTSIALDTHDRSLMVAGFGDGTVRLYDKRNPLSCRYVLILLVYLLHLSLPLSLSHLSLSSPPPPLSLSLSLHSLSSF